MIHKLKYFFVHYTTVEPVYNGHLYKQVTSLYQPDGKIQMESIACIIACSASRSPSIAATFGGPQGDHYRQVPL